MRIAYDVRHIRSHYLFVRLSVPHILVKMRYQFYKLRDRNVL